MSVSSTTTNVVAALIGGVLIGTASALYMAVAGKVAGCSGSVKACVLATTPFDGGKPTDASRVSNILFAGGLVTSGIVVSFVAPWTFENYAPLSADWATYVFGGLLVGSGTYFGNGCTSGHGLAGLSRFSLRSLVATPIFMVAAALTSMIKSQFAVGDMAPFVEITGAQLESIGWISLGLLILAIPMFIFALSSSNGANGDVMMRRALLYSGIWCGCTFGAGLCIGGMARPSSISGALSPQRFDLTLWILFMTALAVTFVGYRLCERFIAARKEKARALKQGPINGRLVCGALLFGVGWGLTGMCPGPILVGLGADFNSGAVTGGPLICLASVVIGQIAAAWIVSKGWLFKQKEAAVGATKSKIYEENSTVDEIQSALEAGANVMDLRGADQREADSRGEFVVFEGSVSAVYNRSENSLPTKCLPTDEESALVLMCKSGKRARLALQHTETLEKYKEVLCCSASQLSEAVKLADNSLESKGSFRFIEHSHNLTLSGKAVFLQFQDPMSSTYTYILGDKETGDAVIIDPVLERLEHDLAVMKEYSLSPSLAINTHCHADHITSTGKMKERLPNLKSMISKSSGADADIHVTNGQVITWANDKRKLKAISTPGHTEGCMSFIDADIGCVFTGDCLLIDGCGRTDFQGGSSKTLYESVHNELFKLDPGTLVYPGHDYKGRACSTIGHEKKYNSRLTKSLEQYVDLMENLGLSFPKKLKVAVPANMKCGI